MQEKALRFWSQAGTTSAVERAATNSIDQDNALSITDIVEYLLPKEHEITI